MTEDPITWLTAGLALAGVVAVLLLLARGARAVGLAPGAPGRQRRLSVQEVLALDARRRLVLVRCDAAEALLLTGGGQDQLLGWLPAAGSDRDTAAPAARAADAP